RLNAGLVERDPLGSGPWASAPTPPVLLGRLSWSSTIYDALAQSCAALASKTGRASDKVRLLQLADQWRTVPADGQGSGKKPPFAATLAGDAVEPVGWLARP